MTTRQGLLLSHLQGILQICFGCGAGFSQGLVCCCSSRFHQLLPSSNRVVLQRLGLVMGAIAAFEGGATATKLLQATCELAQRQASQALTPRSSAVGL